jgi:hypothetical protein
MNLKSKGSSDANIFFLGESSLAFFVVKNWFRFVLDFLFFFFFQSSISMAKDWLIFVSIGGLGFEK